MAGLDPTEHGVDLEEFHRLSQHTKRTPWTPERRGEGGETVARRMGQQEFVGYLKGLTAALTDHDFERHTLRLLRIADPPRGGAW
jgi:hypothetical protein